jgi:hypothetical protein
MKTAVSLSAALLAIAASSGCASQNMLVSANTSQCAHLVWHGSLDQGRPITLRQCIGRRNEFWSIADGQISGIGGACFDVDGSAPVEGAGVIAVACNGSPSQHWALQGTNVVGIGGKCLDTLHGDESDGTPLIISSCSGAPTQQWQVH